MKGLGFGYKMFKFNQEIMVNSNPILKKNSKLICTANFYFLGICYVAIYIYLYSLVEYIKKDLRHEKRRFFIIVVVVFKRTDLAKIESC